MKNYYYLITLTIVLLISLPSFSQTPQTRILDGKEAAEISDNAVKVRLKDFSDVPNYIEFREGKGIHISKIEKYMNKFLGIDGLSFEKQNSIKGKQGNKHVRYVQTYKGKPIEYSAYIFHFHEDVCYSMNGNIPSNPQIKGNFSITPDEALNYAENHIGAEEYMYETDGRNPYSENFEKPVPEKVYIPENGDLYSNKFRAAYKVDVFALKPHSRDYVYIDAQSGDILHKMTRIHNADAQGTANTGYSGTQTITTDSFSGGYRLRESGRGNGIETYNCQNTTDYSSAIDFTDSDNIWDSFSPQIDQYSTDAHFATEKTYDYFYNVHNRNSIDGNGFTLKSYIHFSLVNAGYPSNVNAFWDGQRMTYGDGNSNLTPLTTVDITAHEITHGLTSYTCNLNYQDEPGALNEAFSDIFAVTVEKYAVPSYFDWTVAEDIGSAFRGIDDPNTYNLPDTYQGNYWHTDASDNGGVHTNMGALSYWYYILCQGDAGTNDNGDYYDIQSIGMDAAADIAFRMQTVYLTNTSQYQDARFYGIKAAEDFHGKCTDTVGRVTDAFYAIGVGPAYVAGIQAGFTSDFTENCEPPFLVKFDNQSVNGDNFTWYFGDGATSTQMDPSHIYNSFGKFSVKLVADGGTCGIDSVTKTDYITVDPSVPCTEVMPQNGTGTSDKCNGILYDNGGPSSNYSDNSDATFIIEPSGASQVTLDIQSFDIEEGSGSTCDFDYIEFYDGNSTSATLINNTSYCNTTGNPGTITSSGGAIAIKFHSDQALNKEGFKISWTCQQPNDSPVADFSASTLNSCEGRISFTDESSNVPDSWMWDFGDGNTSTSPAPQHVYSQSGTYNISLTVSNAYGTDDTVKNSYITVNMNPEPQVNNQTVCKDSLFNLNIAGNDIRWFTDSSCTNLAHSGSSWNHPPLQNDKKYFIREFYLPAEDTTGESNLNSGGGYFSNSNYIHYLIFDVYESFTLKSVRVKADGSKIRTVSLRDQNSNVIQSKDIYINDGTSRIQLDFDVPAGQDLQLAGLGGPDLYRTSSASYLSYPYEIDSVLSIKYSSANSDPYGYYYYFYDWIIQRDGCESETAVMDIDVHDCTVGINENNKKNITVYPNPSENYFYIKGFENLDKNASISLVDLSGKLIINEINEAKVNTNNLKSGIYFLRIKDNDQLKRFKIIKK